MTKRRKPQDTNTHHRLPRSKGGGNDTNNLVQVNVTKHRAWHTLFQNYSPEQIADIINRTWIPTNCKMVVRRTHDQAEQMPKPPLPEVH
jgi:hypothetical protein